MQKTKAEMRRETAGSLVRPAGYACHSGCRRCHSLLCPGHIGGDFGLHRIYLSAAAGGNYCGNSGSFAGVLFLKYVAPFQAFSGCLINLPLENPVS